jgi:hypothetical protein
MKTFLGLPLFAALAFTVLASRHHASAVPFARTGDLDSTQWSVGRVVGGYDNSNLIVFPSVPVSACKAGVSSVLPDGDILACDAASGHGGQYLVATGAENYGLISLRKRGAFDFAGRTGVISWKADAVTYGNLGYWTGVALTEDPVPTALNSMSVSGSIPRSGIVLNLDNVCANGGNRAGAAGFYVYVNHVETFVSFSGMSCVTTQRGKLNRFELRMSQTRVEFWGSDFSPDGGATYPNFRMIGSANLSLGFTRAYVHYNVGNRAPSKYGINPPYANYYWQDMTFDGPAVLPETAYMVPDSLTVNGSGRNIGYLLNPLRSFTVPNVVVPSSGALVFTVSHTFVGASPTTLKMQFRWNGGPWRDALPSPTGLQPAAALCQAWGSGYCNWSIAYSTPVAPSDLVAGTNTLEVQAVTYNTGWAPILANAELIGFGIAAPTNTPTNTSTPTNTPTPTATPTPAPITYSCVRSDGAVIWSGDPGGRVCP